ncbi:MAG: M3 family metallopeptidase [Mediterranea sp.]|nr:M3 family metallopeptidase [Mediterranea sp.]
MNTTIAQNPFLQPYQTPHGTAPFDRIRLEHYEPAVMEGMKQQNAEIDAIVQNPEAPTFKNTIEAYEASGELLERVSSVFGNLMSAETNDEMQALARKLMPLMTEHGNNISLNEALFARIKAVYDQRNQLHLNSEQQQLLKDIYEGFALNGANLQGADRDTYRELSNRLSLLTLQFSENLLKATNSYQLLLTNPEQVKGLPQSALDAARESAQQKGMEGWRFTLDYPSYVPFMEYADSRELRRELYTAYASRAKGGETDNLDVVKQIVNTRLALAQLLGYPDYVSYKLTQRMARTTEAVNQLLDQLLEAYTPAAQQEVKRVEELARKEQGKDFILMPYDWSYYAHKLKDATYQLNDEMLRPYFQLEKVIDGVFGLATRLYGITFKANPDIPVYHPEVTAYEVLDRDGSFLAVLYTDFHPREGKRSGAWMTEYKGQWHTKNGENSRPHVSLVTNFSRSTANKPALLTFDEVETLLHEFGHCLHGIFANTTYRSLSGTNVYWDFVELPSQIMENFATEKEFLHTFARHYESGELIPDELIQRIVASANFNAGYLCLRQVSFGLLDMAWYSRTTPFEGDVQAYERTAWQRAQLLPQVNEACMSTTFSHIFAGGYAGGYYSYKWAEVLDADAFSLFKQKGIFNTEVAQSFRDNILSKGGTEDPMTLYVRFRGQQPTIDALLKRNGIR